MPRGGNRNPAGVNQHKPKESELIEGTSQKAILIPGKTRYKLTPNPDGTYSKKLEYVSRLSDREQERIALLMDKKKPFRANTQECGMYLCNGGIRKKYCETRDEFDISSPIDDIERLPNGKPTLDGGPAIPRKVKSITPKKKYYAITLENGLTFDSREQYYAYKQKSIPVKDGIENPIERTEEQPYGINRHTKHLGKDGIPDSAFDRLPNVSENTKEWYFGRKDKHEPIKTDNSACFTCGYRIDGCCKEECKGKPYDKKPDYEVVVIDE